jgi:hypothetical protein
VQAAAWIGGANPLAAGVRRGRSAAGRRASNGRCPFRFHNGRTTYRHEKKHFGIGAPRAAFYAVLASAIVAAFHADLVTMFVVWAPLYLMYEISTWMARLAGTRRYVVAAA